MITFKEIQEFFENNPDKIKDNVYLDLDKVEKVTNGYQFVETTLETLKTNTGNRTYMGAWFRLVKYYSICHEAN